MAIEVERVGGVKYVKLPTIMFKVHQNPNFISTMIYFRIFDLKSGN
jgi:hypothetical protein